MTAELSMVSLAKEPDTVAVSIATFLESVPPSQIRAVTPTILEFDTQHQRQQVLLPEIKLHCTGNNCNGPRIFRSSDEYIDVFIGDEWTYQHVTYVCSNCRSNQKVFSLAIRTLNPNGVGAKILTECLKLGEHPTYGPPTPPRLISLIGPDREVFLRGRRCESQGLGIGAFAYYRRVVEIRKTESWQTLCKWPINYHHRQIW
jgi:hypothetical protein